MSPSTLFIQRPVGTILMTVGIALAGIMAFYALPVARLPSIDLPVLNVTATLPGASPQTMGSSVAEPLERHFASIAGLTEMTSRSALGITQVTMQFDLSRSADGAARDVQAAINAARVDLPTTLKANPTYRKINPADAPIMILSLTSASRSPAQIYDAVSVAIQQRLLQVPGVGDVELAGAALPAVRIDLDPSKLNSYGIPLEDVRSAISSSAGNRPKGAIENGTTAWLIDTRTPGLDAADYRTLIIAWRNGAAVRLSDVARISDGAEDIRTAGFFNGRRAVDVIVSRQPGANVIQTIAAIKEELPRLRTSIPAGIRLDIASDLSTTIRASLREVEVALLSAILIVIAVVGLFLRSWRAAVVPAVATIASLLGTLGVMYLLGFSLDNLSLMALAVATGFVVDDAIVVLENVQRHIEQGSHVLRAALDGAREVRFTVLAITVGLIAVFAPILFMAGLPGRLFHEFAATMTIAVSISLVLSLTTTPVICTLMLGKTSKRPTTRISRFVDRVRFEYSRVLDWVIANPGYTATLLVGTLVVQIILLGAIPKGLFPEEDTGAILGGVRSDEGMSFRALESRLQRIGAIIRADPGVENVVLFSGGQRIGGSFLFVTLKDQKDRASARQIVTRLRRPLSHVTGTTTFLNPVQDLRSGGRQTNATYAYTLTSRDEVALANVAAKLTAALRRQPVLTDVNNDMSGEGGSAFVSVSRPDAARLGITPSSVDQTLYDAFGQRQVSIIYDGLDQYHVVMELAPQWLGSPAALSQIYVPAGPLTPAAAQRTAPGTTSRDLATGIAVNTKPTMMVPLRAIAHWATASTPTQTNHQGTASAATISFNLAGTASIGEAAEVVEAMNARLRSANVQGAFAGTAQVFQQSLATLPWLVLVSIFAIYIVLGILYESWLHPLTVLSTLPPAAVGAVAALLMLGMEFDLIAAIGLILLIGIVMKNAILIIDFALAAERERGATPKQAIRLATLTRLRPILMTTVASALGALPLAIGFGEGAELRRPLGVAIFGGLLVSQIVTLVTTPAIYLLLDRLRRPGVAMAPDPELQPV